MYLSEHLGGEGMTEMEAIGLFKCLADKSRLQILKSLAVEDMYVERLAQRLGLTAATVSFHLKKLAQAGAVSSYKSQYYTMYALNRALFDTTILDIVQEESEEADLQAQRDEAYRQHVLDSFFQDGRLKTIPAQRKKKRIVLQALVEQFEPQRIYPEPEVNAILARYHDDVCTLRRDMVGERLLERNPQGYWRTEESE